MIIVDTNIVSELMKAAPSIKVMAWVNAQEANQLYITTVTIAEITYGLATLDQGKRRDSLEDAFTKAVLAAFKYRVLSFDEPAAHIYGKIMGHRKEIGRPLSILDGQIAAIAKAHDATLATRNIKDFGDCEIPLINPFK